MEDNLKFNIHEKHKLNELSFPKYANKEIISSVSVNKKRGRGGPTLGDIDKKEERG